MLKYQYTYDASQPHHWHLGWRKSSARSSIPDPENISKTSLRQIHKTEVKRDKFVIRLLELVWCSENHDKKPPTMTSSYQDPFVVTYIYHDKRCNATMAKRHSPIKYTMVTKHQLHHYHISMMAYLRLSCEALGSAMPDCKVMTTNDAVTETSINFL